ncbi:histone deacetylase complex subunit SAP130-A [Nephila pilipes]|uniref:Histone deacetylase complex subunit SAP130-A n=1 Tax=Nephila pilipes TaxID=299642 RepID=A0A8X6P9N3_NEPPI|nr:histone deacetylase complex subunit SAP130-A [Nephila pilipes]
MPTSDITQAGTTTASSSGALTQGILPSALSGGSRHMIPTAVHPVIAAANSGPSMASIIRSSHQIPPSGHVIHQQSFSSHVPRGPAAVASISAAPKSAVATPILRAPHSSTTMALASSSMMALHAPVRAKSPTLVSRTATPPVGSSSLPQVVDLQKSTGHSLSSSTTHIGLGSRTVDGSVVRTGPSHSSSITIAKPINISQPIVQHLQQVYEKGNLKTGSNMSSTGSSTSNSTPAHQAMPPSGFTSVSESVGVPSISRSVNSSGYSTNIMQLSPAAVGQSLQTLRATHVNPSMHSNVSSSVAPHQTLVISAKSLMPANHSITLATTSARTATPSTSVSVSGNASVAPSLSSRPNSINPTTIPVAKVYPQSPITSRAISEPSIPDNARVGNFSSQSSNSVRVTASSSTPQSVMITEKQGENNSTIRFTSLSKPQTASSATYAPSPTTYLYHDQYPNLAMHPYTPNPSSGGFTSTQLRPVSFSQHSSNNTSSHSSTATNPVQPISSVMVAVDSRHHVAMHPSYGGKNADISNAPIASNGSTPIGQATVVTTSYNSQGNVNNHTSPRPSILRKRTSESLNTVVKKNLSGNLCVNEPISPRSDVNSNANFTSVLSPKPNSEKSKEGVTSMIPASSESHNVTTSITSSTFKKESGISENACHNIEGSVKDMRIVEASPRKKPRKQLLAANELMETHSSEGDENNFDSKVRIKEEHDEEKTKYVTFYKRPSMSLLSSYRQTWKARLNHFARYSDVKPKEEKKPTVNELANQKGILQQANGWKVYHLSAQMEEVIELEETVYSRLSHLLEFVEKDPKAHRNRNISNSDEDRIINKLTDLIKGNLQRSKIVQEQVAESKSQAIKVLDHKTNVIEMVNKYISRRPLKKKEKS